VVYYCCAIMCVTGFPVLMPVNVMTSEDNLLNSKLNVRIGKKGDLSNFECGMVVGARQAGLSISQSHQLLGFSRTTIYRFYKEWCEKGKTSSMRQFYGRKMPF